MKTSATTTISKETAEFLLLLVGRVTLGADDPQFEEMAAKIVQAKKELEEVISI